jgi:hypothetical protein
MAQLSISKTVVRSSNDTLVRNSNDTASMTTVDGFSSSCNPSSVGNNGATTTSATTSSTTTTCNATDGGGVMNVRRFFGGPKGTKRGASSGGASSGPSSKRGATSGPSSRGDKETIKVSTGQRVGATSGNPEHVLFLNRSSVVTIFDSIGGDWRYGKFLLRDESSSYQCVVTIKDFGTSSHLQLNKTTFSGRLGEEIVWKVVLEKVDDGYDTRSMVEFIVRGELTSSLCTADLPTSFSSMELSFKREEFEESMGLTGTAMKDVLSAKGKFVICTDSTNIHAQETSSKIFKVTDASFNTTTKKWNTALAVVDCVKTVTLVAAAEMQDFPMPWPDDNDDSSPMVIEESSESIHSSDDDEGIPAKRLLADSNKTGVEDSSMIAPPVPRPTRPTRDPRRPKKQDFVGSDQEENCRIKQNSVTRGSGSCEP